MGSAGGDRGQTRQVGALRSPGDPCVEPPGAISLDLSVLVKWQGPRTARPRLLSSLGLGQAGVGQCVCVCLGVGVGMETGGNGKGNRGLPAYRSQKKRLERNGVQGDLQPQISPWEHGAQRGLRRGARGGARLSQCRRGLSSPRRGSRVRAGKPAPRGLGRSVGGPAPRAGSQWPRRRRVTEGAQVLVPRRRRRRTALPERAGLGVRGGPGDAEPGSPGRPGRRRGPRGSAMPLAQLKEPWPLMELVPLDPEVSERGPRGSRARVPSGRGAGGGSRGCGSQAGALLGTSVLPSLASPAPPPSARVCVYAREGVSPSAPSLSPEMGSPGTLRSGAPHLGRHLAPLPLLPPLVPESKAGVPVPGTP